MIRSRAFPETRASLLATLGADDAIPTPTAWREFFDRYAPAVFRVARMQGLDANDADDIVQQVMLAVARQISTFVYDKDRGAFRTWVRRIAENKIADFFRSRRNQVSADGLAEHPDHRPSLDAMWRQEWRRQDLLWCLDQVSMDFSPRRMEAFRLYVLEELSAEEVARRTGLTVGHVYVIRTKLINRVREQMKRLRAREGDE